MASSPPGRDDDPLPQVTARHLRAAEELCRRRLALEHRRRPGANVNRGGTARFEVASRVEADARLAHATRRRPTAEDFPVPTDLFPEQQRLHAAAAAGYLALFGDRAARTVDGAELDPLSTEVPGLGVRLTGGTGLVVEVTPGRVEVRLLRLGRASGGSELLHDADVRVAVLRAGELARDGMRIVAADLLDLEVLGIDVDLAVARPAAREWLAERVAVVRRLATRPVPRAGHDCATCGFVAGCAPVAR